MAEGDQEMVVFKASDRDIWVYYILLCICFDISKLKVKKKQREGMVGGAAHPWIL